MCELNNLTLRQRQAVELYAYGWELKRIAACMGVTRNTVKRFLEGARARLRLDPNRNNRVELTKRVIEANKCG